jgi:hypothetical protein
MVVHLGNGRSVPGEPFDTLFIRFKNRLVYFLVVLLQPCQKCGPEIETDLCIVIDDIDDLFVLIENAGCRIWCIAFGSNAFISVVIWIGRILNLDFLKPGVFAGRLVKMTVNTDKTTHAFIPFPGIVLGSNAGSSSITLSLFTG